MNPEASLWLESSAYDLECAASMLREKKFNYTVFFCHQSIEKILKAIILSEDKTRFLRTHDLKELYAQTDCKMPDEMVTFLMRLNPHYMVSRYPDMSGTAGYENYNKAIADDFLNETKKVYAWLHKSTLFK